MAINCEKQTNFHAFATFCLHILQFYALVPDLLSHHDDANSQRTCASAVEKTPSFSFCQVDMYALSDSPDSNRPKRTIDDDNQVIITLPFKNKR